MVTHKIICTNPNCEYVWVAKVKKPKACPKCRQYIKTNKNQSELFNFKRQPQESE